MKVIEFPQQATGADNSNNSDPAQKPADISLVEFPQQDPDADLINMLEELLESAKSGELKALCCAGLEKDGTMFTQVCTDTYLEMQALWAMALKAT